MLESGLEDPPWREENQPELMEPSIQNTETKNKSQLHGWATRVAVCVDEDSTRGTLTLYTGIISHAPVGLAVSLLRP
jgi:hypothetical protein